MKVKHFLKEAGITIVVACLFTLFVRTLIYDPYHIPSSSMTPTLRTGDRIFVNKFYYGYSAYSIPMHPFNFSGRFLSFRSPKRGDIVVFMKPGNSDKRYYIKRIVGLPGDKIRVTKSRIVIEDKKSTYFFLRDLKSNEQPNENNFDVSEYLEINQDNSYYKIFIGDYDTIGDGAYQVPEGQYFMMGDNRTNSADSRFDSMGFIPFDNIVGRAEIVFFSSSKNAPYFVRFNRIGKIIVPKKKS